MSKADFNIAGFRTFAGYHKGATAFLDMADKVQSNVAKVYLSSAILTAMRSPGATVNAIADGAIDGLSRNPATVANYRSQMVKAVSFARAKAIIPTLDPNVGEADVLAQVAKFCESYTLRGLYDEARKPAIQKADERKVEREAKAAEAEAKAKAQAGVQGETALSVAKLLEAVTPWLEAANAGNEDAARVLAHLEATLFADRKGREEAAAATPALPKAANG